MIIGLDFDGVIIDHHENKMRLAKELGYKLERRQTNTNLMRQFLPSDKAEELKESLYTVSTPSATSVSGSFEAMAKLPKETYIISARTKESVKFAKEWMTKYKLFDLIPPERIIFCRNGAAKGPLCEQLKVTHFLDDKFSFLKYLPLKTKKILFDEDGVAAEINVSSEIQVVGNWGEFLSLILGRD